LAEEDLIFFISERDALLASTALMLSPIRNSLASVLPPLYVGAVILMVMDGLLQRFHGNPSGRWWADLLLLPTYNAPWISIRPAADGLAAGLNKLGPGFAYIFLQTFWCDKRSLTGGVPTRNYFIYVGH